MTFVFRSGVRFCSCGFDISNYRDTAKTCIDCRRKASPVKTCKECGTQFQELNLSRCTTCQCANYVYRRYASGQTIAAAAVAQARNKGALRPPREFDCVDCGASATEYDHRDYSKPLDVDPVCRGCNRRRGSAKRKDWSFDEFWAWFQINVASNHNYGSKLGLSDFDPIRRKYWPELAQTGRRSTDKEHKTP